MTTPNRDAVRTSLSLIQALRSLDPEMGLQQAEILLLIAQKPGISSEELGRRSGLSQSSVSRNTTALGEWHRLNKPGLGLVEWVEDPRERRRHLFFLTISGRAKLSTVFQLLDPEYEYEGPTAKEAILGIRNSLAATRSR